jgi:hypothetical protein
VPRTQNVPQSNAPSGWETFWGSGPRPPVAGPAQAPPILSRGFRPDPARPHSPTAPVERPRRERGAAAPRAQNGERGRALTVRRRGGTRRAARPAPTRPESAWRAAEATLDQGSARAPAERGPVQTRRGRPLVILGRRDPAPARDVTVSHTPRTGELAVAASGDRMSRGERPYRMYLWRKHRDEVIGHPPGGLTSSRLTDSRWADYGF